jgi:ABC-2 type transport system ATP-binding protein
MLEVKGLGKDYGGFTAVKTLDFNLEPGEIFGFIGSNGAGKTTTIKMIASLLEPTRGTAVLDGFDVRTQSIEVRRRLGYMPDFFGLYEDIKVWEYLDFFASLYSVSARERPGVIDTVLELTDLSVKKDSFVSELSRGMQQRLCLAKCLVHDPQLLLLDEPASGLDPRARSELKGLIAELGAMGKTVIVSSHILPELADFCTSVGIIEQGELKAMGPVAEISQAIVEEHVIEIRLLESVDELAEFLKEKPHIKGLEKTGPKTLQIEFEGGEAQQAELLKYLIDTGYPVIEFIERTANLEDVFLKVTTGAVQ